MDLILVLGIAAIAWFAWCAYAKQQPGAWFPGGIACAPFWGS